MKLAVASFGNSIDSSVDLHTGRAASFILYDTDRESYEVLDNWHHAQFLHWAGSNTAKTLAVRDQLRSWNLPSALVQSDEE